MKGLTGPSANLLLPFRSWMLQKIFSYFLLFSFLHLVAGCNFYRVREDNTVTAEKLAGLPNYKRFILHQGKNSWELKDLAMQENALVGNLQTLPSELIPYVNAKAGSPHRYKSQQKSTALNIVHLYVYEFAQSKNNQVRIPIAALKRLAITDKDNGATVASYTFTTVAALGVAFSLVAVIALLLKSSCPFVYVYNGNSYQFIGEAYGGAIFSPLERDDYMPLPDWQAGAGKVQVKITNELKERQYTNLAELQVVQHPKGMQVLLDQQGQPHTLQNIDKPLTAVAADGADYAAALAARDSSVWAFNSSQKNFNAIKLQFRKPANSETGKLVLHAQNSLWLDYMFGEFTKQFGSIYNRWAEKQKDVTAAELYQWQQDQGIPLLVEVQTLNGWEVVARIPPVGPLAARDLVVPLNLSKIKGEEVNVRLSCGFMFWEVDRAGMDFSPNLPVAVKTIKAASAFEKSGQNVSHLVAANDKDYLEQFRVGDAVTLTYLLPKINKGQELSLFLHTRGYYEHIRDYKGIPNLITLREFEKPGRFIQFSRDRYEQLARQNNFYNLFTAHASAR